MVKKDDYQTSHTLSDLTIKARVVKELNKNPLLTAKPLCFILQLDYNYYKDYIAHIRSEWKHDLRFRQGLKGLISIHNWHGYIYAIKELDRKKDKLVTEFAVEHGWILTKAKNRMLLWKDKRLGRLEWFETGRIKIWLKKPVTLGNLKQLFADAFLWTKMIDSVDLFEKWLKTFKKKGFHFIFDTGQKLPYAKIDLFKGSNGIAIKTGDISHPTCIELEINYPDWAERLELLTDQNIKAIEKFAEFIQFLSQPKAVSKNGEKMIS